MVQYSTYGSHTFLVGVNTIICVFFYIVVKIFNLLYIPLATSNIYIFSYVSFTSGCCTKFSFYYEIVFSAEVSQNKIFPENNDSVIASLSTDKS